MAHRVSDGRQPPFPIEETHGIPLYPGNRLLAHSGELGWTNVYASYAAERPWQATLRPLSHPCLAYFVNGGAAVQRRVEGERLQQVRLQARQFGLVPTRAASRWDLVGTPEILTLYLHRDMVDRMAAEVFGKDPRRVELRPQLGVTDPLLEQLAWAILRAMRDGDTGLYVDQLAYGMAARMLRAHCSGIGQGPPPSVVAPAGKFTRLVDCIEASLDRALTLEALAEIAQMNPYYLARAFRREFGEPPHRYVLGRRLERAKQLLRDTDLPLIEIALATGFASQSHFAATFKRRVGATPGDYRRAVG